MKHSSTSIDDLIIAESDILGDERGSFMRLFSAEELGMQVAQANRSITTRKGSLRGLHFQRAPALEAKFVRCIRGRVLDVAVDLRKGSKTFLQHFSVELDGASGLALMIPGGFAHGFQTLTDNCEMVYFHSTPYSKEYEGGLRYDDPALGIHWPLPVADMSARDKVFAMIDDSFKGID